MSNHKKKIRVVAAEIESDGTYLITQRRANAIYPLLWEFPSGKVEEGESDEKALQRELMERIGISAKIGDLSIETKHEYEKYELDFVVYHCTISDDVQIKALKVNDFRWVKIIEMSQYEFPPADAHGIQKLIDDLNL
jgi:8-oxo-dGTP diphosphatase